MDFEMLSSVYGRLDGISSRLQMTDVVAEFIKEVPDELLSTVLLFLRGTPFPPWSNLELGIADKLMFKALSSVSGMREDRIEGLLREKGDLGLVAESALVNKPQTTLFSSTLTVEKVKENIDKMPTLTGKGSQDRKFSCITELLSNASAQDSKYIVRLVLGQLRLGVGDGTIRDAIAKAYGVDPDLVEHAYNLSPDWGQVAASAKHKGEEGLRGYGIRLGRPIKVMLAQKAADLKEALGDSSMQLEVKYDGARVQIHKDGDDITLFTRRLENITKQFPEIAKEAKESIGAKTAMIEGEIVAISLPDRRPLPFQNLSRRIKRKYDIQEIQEKIPAEVNLFDILYLDGKGLMDVPFKDRRKTLEATITETARFRLAEKLVTSDLKEAEKFYKKSLLMGHEGVMVKTLDAPYQAGSRVGYMSKVKPIMETLDLVVTGATWGRGAGPAGLAAISCRCMTLNAGSSSR
ncbi:MAG: ATP-dependent DNA ligase [Candidatus Altiarchaeota archaeon]